MATARPFPPSGSEDLDGLRCSALTGLCLAGLGVSWVWTITVGTLYGEMPPLAAFVPPLTLATMSALALLGRTLPPAGRNAMFIAGLCGALLLGYLREPDLVWVYYQALVVVIAGLLAGPAAAFLVASGITAALLTARVDPLASPAGALVPPVILLWAMASVSALSSQALFTALEWALNSQRRAWDTADEVRRRRGELRNALDSLKHTYALLERANRELDAARLTAEDAHQVKSRFVANISHELRTPLNVIVGFAEMLCTSPESYGDLDWPATLRADLLTIWRNAEHLLNMVDDVLDLAQIEVSHLPILTELTDPAQFIRESLVTAGALLRESHLELRMLVSDGLPLLYLDRTRIRQVLLNLLNNAVRHTREGYVEVGAQVSGEELVIFVRDSGEGIPPDKLETIFHEFEQADTSLRRPHQGAGLGLAISRHFVRLHGGRIWAESELDKGSTFHFTLPLAGCGSGSRIPELRKTPALAPQHHEERQPVVALSSDPLAIRFLERYLDQPILGCGTVPEALELVRREHPQAALVMADGPDALGPATDTARALLAAAAPLDLPVVACRLPTERRASYTLGVPEFLVKPVVRRDVVAAIRRLRAQPRRILIVDDDSDMLDVLQRMVQSEWEHAEVLISTSGQDALLLAERQPDVILLDLLMPEMSGVEFLARLRAHTKMAAIPVVVITARGPAEDLQGLQKGELSLLKGSTFSAEELVRVLSAVIQSLAPRYVGGRAADLQDTLATAPA